MMFSIYRWVTLSFSMLLTACSAHSHPVSLSQGMECFVCGQIVFRVSEPAMGASQGPLINGISPCYWAREELSWAKRAQFVLPSCQQGTVSYCSASSQLRGGESPALPTLLGFPSQDESKALLPYTGCNLIFYLRSTCQILSLCWD